MKTVAGRWSFVARGILLVLALTVWFAVGVCAQTEPPPDPDRRANVEEIESFHADVTLNDDGSMLVRETIRVHALGQKITHGIYRDFPTDYKDKLGNHYRVPFNIIEVTRDGQPEDYHTGAHDNGVRVYFGSRWKSLPPGTYTYGLVYQTDRQMGFFSDRDELYWNVTGNGWDFPIEQASAKVSLPGKIPRRVVETYGFTGPQGYSGRDFKASMDASGNYLFETSKPLAPYEGLTVVCWWDKGYMQPPTDEQKRAWFMADNQELIVALIGLVLVLAYQTVAWFMVGRDPAPGSIVVQYMPPPDLTPAATRELVKMKFDSKCFAADLLAMAAKKYVTITQEQTGQYIVTASKDPKATNALTAEERLVANRLFARRNDVLLSPVNNTVIRDAFTTLKKSLNGRMEKVYFERNFNWLIPSLVGTLLTLIAVIANADPQTHGPAIFISIWLAGWTVVVVFLSLQVVNAWRTAIHGHGWQQKLSFGGAIFITLFALPFFGGELFGLGAFASATSFLTLLTMMVLVASNFVFHELLKAPTHMGRELLDRVEGFKMFLAATEADQIKRNAPVNWNVDTFNRFLPYAIALDLEKEWAGKFGNVLESAAAVGAGVTSGMSTVTGSVAAAAMAGSLGDSLSGAISSSSGVPGSGSGSGGGGSSGGGGGGGGGGGW